MYEITDTNVAEAVKSLNDYFISKLLKKEYKAVAYSKYTITVEICGFRFTFYLMETYGQKYLLMFNGPENNLMALEFPNGTEDEIYDVLHSNFVQREREVLLEKRNRIDERLSKLQ